MTFATEVIISGFVSKVVNNCFDVTWDKIKRAVKDKNNKHQSLESQIYNITVDVFNRITNNQYKNNQEKIYEAAEILLLGYKNIERDDIEVLKSSLKLFYPDVDNDKCMEFIKLLYQELSQDVYEVLYREIRLLQEEQESRKTTRIEEKVNEIKSGLDDLKISSQIQSISQNNAPKQKAKNRTQEYADKWNSNMFLNNFNKRDENAGVNVKLSEVYLEEHLPQYIWGHNINPSSDLKTLLSDYIEKKIDNNMLLILGQPGIGKSTLITWITAIFADKLDEIMVYQFAADLKDVDWLNQNILDEILIILGLSYDDLNGKTLILDGFDEVNIRGDRNEILDNINLDLNKRRKAENFSLIITCRENYIRYLYFVKYTYITLQPWDEKQIKSFCTCFQEKTKDVISEHTMTRVLENKQIFGIPLILYMILALNISMEKEGSIVDVYDKIFSLKGGIYDRCINNVDYADMHRIGEIKKQIHQISREIAIWMFENNSDEAYIPQKEYEKICNDIKEGEQENENLKRDFKIGSFFRLVKYCEGTETEELYFVHRSIYEYFVAEAIYNSIKEALIELSEESKEQFAGNIAVYLKQGQITNTIGEYLQYMIMKLYQSLNVEKKELFYQWWESVVNMMMISGMFYYTKRNIQDYKSVIYKEVQCFVNILIILRLLRKIGKSNFIIQDADKAVVEIYIKLILVQPTKYKYINLSNMPLEKLNLVEADLKQANLRGADLREANLKEANLRKADLREAYLEKTNFSEADLIHADLVKADLGHAYLYKANLTEANLEGANLIRANLEEANLERANLKGVHLIGVNWKGTNLKSAKLDDSFWLKFGVEEALSLLKQACFHYINVYGDDNKARKVYRSELFPDEDIVTNE